MIHPARTMSYATLVEGLKAAQARRHVKSVRDAETGLVLWTYTNACVYDDGWDEFSLVARGLVLDPDAGRIVATPFPKFFNLGERRAPVPGLNQPFEVFEKLDGSLIIAFHHDGRWRTATKGAFDSSQARWGAARLAEVDTSALVPGTTYLFEAVYPENRIVVHYADPAMVLLAAYRPDGIELTYEECGNVAAGLGWRAAERRSFESIVDMVAHTETLPADSEGFVVRLAYGERLKVKGAEYRRIHALISNCTPLAMWNSMVAGDDLGLMRREIPEEFWSDFDTIVELLDDRLSRLQKAVAAAAAEVEQLTDKELGMSLDRLPELARPFVFPYRKSGNEVTDRIRASMLRTIRPTGNVLEGYVPSYAMNRLQDEDVA